MSSPQAKSPRYDGNGNIEQTRDKHAHIHEVRGRRGQKHAVVHEHDKRDERDEKHGDRPRQRGQLFAHFGHVTSLTHLG